MVLVLVQTTGLALFTELVTPPNQCWLGSCLGDDREASVADAVNQMMRAIRHWTTNRRQPAEKMNRVQVERLSSRKSERKKKSDCTYGLEPVETPTAFR